MTNGLLLSAAAFRSLSASAQQEVLACIGLSGVEPVDTLGVGTNNAIPANASVGDDGEGPVELTVAMVRKLTDKLSEKTLTALKIIARSDGPQFHMKDVIAGTAGAKDYMDMRGVWSALTRRTRNIMDDGEVDLLFQRAGFRHGTLVDAAMSGVEHDLQDTPLRHGRRHIGSGVGGIQPWSRRRR